MQNYILNNGVVVEASDRKGNRTGYTGASIFVAFGNLDPVKPFVAACGNPRDASIKDQLQANKRTAWHGGDYNDAREAAYVVARFKLNPIAIDREIQANGGVYDDFPADLYTLPIFTSLKDAQKIVNDKIAEKRENSARVVKKQSTKRKASLQVNNAPVDKYWAELYEKYNIPALAVKFGKDAIITSRKFLTVNEFELRFGL